MADTDFDPLSYIRTAPIINLESGVLLARTLVEALPARMPAHVKKAAAKLGRTADSAQEALSQRHSELVQPPEETAREIDIIADQLWSALYDTLDALTRLPARFERGHKARSLRAEIFPTGTGFLRTPYSDQFVLMDTTLKRIDSAGLAKTVDAVVGPEFLHGIREVHPRYAAMVARRLREAAPAGNMLTHIRALQRAILEHATAIASTVDSDDPSTIAAARQALRPIDNHRELFGSGRRPEAPADPDEPEPAPDPTTT